MGYTQDRIPKNKTTIIGIQQHHPWFWHERWLLPRDRIHLLTTERSHEPEVKLLILTGPVHRPTPGHRWRLHPCLDHLHGRICAFIPKLESFLDRRPNCHPSIRQSLRTWWRWRRRHRYNACRPRAADDLKRVSRRRSSRKSAARRATVKSCISLSWHMVNQVMYALKTMSLLSG